MTIFSAPDPVVTPALEPEDAPFRVDGDLNAREVEAGRELKLRFSDPYETFLTLDDKRVLGHPETDERNASLWVHRRLLPLWRTLGDRLGLVASLTDRYVLVEDLVELETGRAVDHPRLRRELADCDIRVPAFAILDAPANRAELNARLQQLYAAGTTVEVRDELGGHVARRWRVVVGRVL
jgi:hypothetical protein